MTLGIIFGVMLVVALALVLKPLLLPDKKGKSRSGGKLLFGGVAVVVVAGAIGIYFAVGNPEMGREASFPENFGQGFFDEPEDPRLPSIEVMVDRLRERLSDNPDDLNGWATLGQSLMVLGRYGEAAEAYRSALARGPDLPDFHSALGEALALQADGAVTREALQAFNRALELNPDDQVARFYLGDYAFQRGDVELALERWSALFRDAPPDTPWLPLLEQRITAAANRLGREPPAVLAERRQPAPAQSAEQAIRQMAPDEQQAMIETMVAGLAARLEENPDDIDGWSRLGRSYMVLERPREAAEAYARVVAARPDDPEAQENYTRALLSVFSSEERPVSDEAFDALKRLEQLDPDNTTALYYLGQAALERGSEETARAYWERLLSRLSPDSQDAEFVREKLDSLG